MPSAPQTVTTRPGTLSSTDEATAIPPGYKQTAVGVIPRDWRVSSVGAEFNIQLGKMLDAAKNVGIPKPYIGNRSVQWGRIDSDDIATVPMTGTDLQRFRLRRGDLLVCEGGEIGRAAIWEEPISECYYQKALHRLRTKGRYDAYLMMSLLQLWTSTGYLANYVTQTSIAHLPKDKLEIVPLPVPPPAEQRAIAEALSDVDKLLGSLEKLIAKKRAIKQTAMQQLLTGKTRLPGFSGEWETKQLGNVLAVRHGRSQREVAGPDGKYPILASGGEIGRTDCFLYDKESVLIGRKGTIDDPQFVSSPFWTVDTLFYTEIANGLSAKFLYYKFCMIPWQSYNEASGVPSLNARTIEGIQVGLPRADEQKAIATVLSDMDAEITALERRRDKTRTIKQGMMQQLLTGRVRLVSDQEGNDHAP